MSTKTHSSVKHWPIVAGISLLIVAFSIGWTWPLTSHSKLHTATPVIAKLPDFTGYTDVKKKKNDFFNYLMPMVEFANEQILKDRQWLLALKQQKEISQNEMSRLLKLAEQYKVSTLSPNHVLSDLLLRVDIIPTSLALAQAANESAWGTSRFATQGNNLFGQWCYVKGCGLVPLQQVHGQHYEVAKFKSVQASVISYMKNLNSQFSYESLRKLRKELRDSNQQVTGLTLAEGLLSYSTRRQEYIHEIQSMILHNNLGQFDG